MQPKNGAGRQAGGGRRAGRSVSARLYRNSHSLQRALTFSPRMDPGQCAGQCHLQVTGRTLHHLPLHSCIWWRTRSGLSPTRSSDSLQLQTLATTRCWCFCCCRCCDGEGREVILAAIVPLTVGSSPCHPRWLCGLRGVLVRGARSILPTHVRLRERFCSELSVIDVLRFRVGDSCVVRIVGGSGSLLVVSDNWASLVLIRVNR